MDQATAAGGATAEVVLRPSSRAGWPPGPGFGSLVYHFLRGTVNNQLEAFQLWQQRYGDFVHISIPRRRIYLAMHPELVGRVLVDQKGWQKDWLLRAHRGVFGDGLLTSEGEQWRQQRKMIQPSFHWRRIVRYGEIMVQRTQAAVAGWSNGGQLDAQREMNQLTLDIVLRALFAIEGGDEMAKTGAALSDVMHHFQLHTLPVAPPFWFPLPIRFRYLRAIRTLDTVVESVIDKRRRSGKAGDDLLEMLLEARDEQGSAMSDRQLRDEVLTLLLAGHETTGQTLSFTWDLLARHPEARTLLHDELRTVLGTRAPGVDDLPKLPFLDAVVKESMRLYPPAATLGRDAVVEQELAGFQLAVGATVLLSPWVIHRDARWFDEPAKFKPERWLAGLEQRLPRYAYLPFGAGPRICIGNSFASMEARLILACVAQRFDLDLLDAHQPVELSPSLTLRAKGGIPVRLKAL